jgi:DNA-binding LacI/PurR family transcriptional regulator
MGRTMTRVLLQEIANRSEDRAVERPRIVLPTELVVRESS